MARPIAGDPPAPLPPAPFQTPPAGMPVPAPASPFNYTNQPSMPAPAMQATPTPSGLLNAFRRRWVLGTFVGGLVAAAVAVGIWVALPGGKHEARALVQLRPKGVEFVNKNQENFSEYRGRQVFLLKSRDLITRTLAEPAVASLDMVKTVPDPVTLIEDQIKVAVVADDILQVSLTGNHLDDMKTILDHLVKRYVDDATAFERKERADQVQKLERFSEALRLDIEAQEKTIELLGKANQTTGGADEATRLALLQRRYIELDSEYNRANREIIGLESQLNVLAKQLNDKDPKAIPPQYLVDEEVARDPLAQKKKGIYEAARDSLKRDEMLAVDADNDPFIIEGRTKVAKLKQEAEDAQKGAVAVALTRDRGLKQSRLNDLVTGIEVKKGERERLKEERDGLQKLIAVGVGGGLNIQAMREALKPKRENVEKVNAHLEQLKLANQLDGRASQRGEPDKIPNFNQNKKIAMSSAGGVASFLAVVLLVAFLEWRTRRVDGVDQVVTELGMRVIGTVPAFPNRANLKAAVEAGGANWRFVLNESINSARTMLLHTARTQSMQVVMVTSATQGEGKTSLASQLATSMATAGMRTLIVDCDLRNPSIQKLFELPLGPGVSEILRQEVDVADAVQATAVPNLWVIPAGQCSNATIAALAQGHPMETLFNRLRGQFDFIIVDSCPVLPVADALLIGQHVDGVVFSIMQDVSQLPKVMTATEKLNQLNIPLVGAVVNGIKQDVYSYGYNYVKQLPA
jgi:capsular exopolysaccharide synthesis family protein